MVLPAGAGVPMPAQYSTERFDSDFTTLLALLDDPVHREAIMGRGELTWCEMRQHPRIGGRPVLETDYPKIRAGLEGFRRASDGKPLRFSLADIASAVPMLASRRTVHPVREWLSGLTWDGVPRVGQLAIALGQAPDSFAATLLRRWLISAVARPMTPGCKVDTVLVLIGQQGAGKSTFFSTLAGEAWHTDSRVDVADKDGKLVMRQVWVVEWAELEAMRRAKDQEAIKAFLSARVDVFRRPYAREVQEAPRHCVVVGTTNNKEFLFDATGSRRFWPVQLTARVDLQWVRAHREQLWAEAVAAFRAGEQWWLTPEEDEALALQNAEHEAQDIWTDPVRDWLEEHRALQEVQVGQMLKLALNRDLENWSRVDEMRVSAILRQLGWTGPHRPRREGGRSRVWRRPEGGEW
jgi:putative DNA primase/helicase